MPTPAEPSLTPELITTLLAQPTAVAQAEFLQQANLWHAAGLAALLETGGQLLNRDLPQARQLLDVCLAFAPELAPALHPQALYLRAQTLALTGEFEQALAEIALAQAGYQATGQTAAALRTHVGQINVLIHLGRYAAALDTVEAALTAIGQTTDLPAETAVLLTAHLQNNRGICYKFMGRYSDALFAYKSAESQFQAIGLVEDIANIQMNLGVMLAELGYGHEALAAYEMAAAIYAQTGNQWRQAQNLENVGEVHLWLGNYTQSLEAFAAARDLFATLDAPLELHILERLTADAYLTLNLLPEATAAYRQAIAGLEASDTSPDVPHYLGGALWGLGATLLRRNRPAEAADLLSRAADIFAAAGNDHLRSAVLLEQAALAEAQGDRETAVQQTQHALALVADQDWPVQRVYAHLRLADLYLPDTATAEPLLLEAQQIAAGLPLPQLRVGVQQRLGRLYLQQGREEEAETMLTTAVSEIERLRGALARQSLRTSFLQDKTAVYADLARLYLGRGDQASLQKAFSFTEQAKSRALVDLLSNDIAAQLQQNLPPDLAGRLQTLQADLHAIYNEALRDNQEGDRAAWLLELNTRATQLEEEISRLRLQADAAASAADGLAPAMPFTALQQTLPPDLPLLAYYVLDDELLAFIYRDGKLQVARHLSRMSVIGQHLAALTIEWQRFQADPAFIQRHLPRLTHSVQQVLQVLYRELMAPLHDLLADCSRLVIIPHGLLHHVPFAALYDGRTYLVDRVELCIAPSATVLHLSRQRPSRPHGPAAIFGVADPLIPFAGQEATAVSQFLPQARLHLGEQATMANVQHAAANCALLHLACHGLFRRDNPFFSALKLHDGWLTAADALRLKLPGTFVTLSACESGRSEVIGGDELLGLVYAFLGAGASGLLVSLWLVEDETTATLMTDFYRYLVQGGDPAAALRQAQLSLRATHPHPYFWAPFVLIGA
ncbi:MAG: CHAT domain-containing protein [Anaerolineae bacterium]|nr:CHAT domain-containing protein [Anaerolineae bacterium]